jgi:hypothetical protein
LATLGTQAPRLRHSLIASATVLSLGQAVLVLLGPYSRGQGTFTRREGIAFLAPDSAYYLRSSETVGAILDAPWTNWTYLLLVRVGHLVGDAATVTALIQLLIALAIGVALHRAIAPVAGSLGGWAAVAAFSLNPFVAQWFRFVHTETLFFGIVVAVVLLASGLGSQSPQSESGTVRSLLLLGLAAAGVRPNGSLVLVSVVALIVWHKLPPRRAMVATAALVAATPIILLAGLNTTGQPFESSLTAQLHSGVVIEGTDEVRVRVTMPPPSDPEDESIAAAVRYAVAYPFATARLAASRILAEALQIRPHYPQVVNVAAGVAILIYLGAGLHGLLDRLARPLRRPIGFVMVPILLLVGLTFATPEARYGWGGLVALAPVAGIGVGRVAERRPLPTPAPSERDLGGSRSSLDSLLQHPPSDSADT